MSPVELGLPGLEFGKVEAALCEALGTLTEPDGSTAVAERQLLTRAARLLNVPLRPGTCAALRDTLNGLCRRRQLRLVEEAGDDSRGPRRWIANSEHHQAEHRILARLIELDLDLDPIARRSRSSLGRVRLEPRVIVPATAEDVAEAFARERPRLCLVEAGAGAAVPRLIHLAFASLRTRGYCPLLIAGSTGEGRRLSPARSALDAAALAARCERAEAAPGTQADAVLVVGADALGVTELAGLLDAIPSGAAVMLIGDSALPPPTGAGSPFHDLLDGAVVPVFLLQPPRQSLSALERAQRRIRLGHAPEWGGPVKLLRCAAIDRLPAALHAAWKRVRAGLAADSVLILSCGRSGPAGSEHLGHALDQLTRSGGRRQRARARVSTCGEARETFTEAVVLVVHEEAELDREALYLAATRARSRLVVVGQLESIQRALRLRRPRRRTLLGLWLTGQAAPPTKAS